VTRRRGWHPKVLCVRNMVADLPSGERFEHRMLAIHTIGVDGLNPHDRWHH